MRVSSYPAGCLTSKPSTSVRTPPTRCSSARVNRGYGYIASMAASSDWTYKPTEPDPGELAALRKAIARLFSGGDLVGPGDEISFGPTNASAAAFPNGQPTLIH